MDNYLVVDKSLLDNERYDKMFEKHLSDDDFLEFYFGSNYGACVQTVVNGEVKHVDNVKLPDGMAVIVRRSVLETYFKPQELSKLRTGQNYAIMPFNKDKKVVLTAKVGTSDEVYVLNEDCTKVLYIVC